MSHKASAFINAVGKIREHQKTPELQDFADRIAVGDRVALSVAFTYLESTRKEHFEFALQLLNTHKTQLPETFRIGITGVPGVGKSTLIEALGLHYLSEGHRVAVLAVDPSSPVSSGSILGDKTRMQNLSMHPNAFIRPSAAGKALGGVTNDTKLAIQLCEMAGFDRIIVETVGVGQSEVAVHEMTDMFVLLMLAGAGDQLQGIKRGIVELCDAMVITKADGDNLAAAQRAKAEYLSALHLISPKSSGWIPEIVNASALQPAGINDLLNLISKFQNFALARNIISVNRKAQDSKWLESEFREIIFKRWLQNQKDFRLNTANASESSVTFQLLQIIEWLDSTEFKL